MYQGFYNLTSGMLSQQRNLNVISNNMANTQTAGYKADTMTKKTFQEEMLVRTGRYNKKKSDRSRNHFKDYDRRPDLYRL